MASSSYNFSPVVIGAPTLTTIVQTVTSNSGDNDIWLDSVNVDSLIGERIFLRGTVTFKNKAESPSYARFMDVGDSAVYQTFTMTSNNESIELEYEDTFEVKIQIAGQVEVGINFKLL